MDRDIIGQLAKWKDSPTRKPLILVGARQVGKTWALRKFGETHYQKVAYIVFEHNDNMQRLFEQTLSPTELLPFLRAETGVDIQPNDTLIIFDEVQAVPNAITSLKYFYEEAPEYSIVAAGSTLGITLHDSGSFPVGKVDFMTLHPMSFEEFLSVCGEKELRTLIDQANDYSQLEPFHNRLDAYLRQYFYVGGMPEAVKSYIANQSYDDARAIQLSILESYNQDFSKHATPTMATKLRMLWQAIPSQLANKNKRFIYGAVKSGARARDYETAIQWLADSSMINKVNRVNSVQQPLKAYEDFGAFKLFTHDIGLLSAMVNATTKAIIDEQSIYTEFKGALAKQFVCQELIASGKHPCYWSSDDSKKEIDFLIEGDDGIEPIEVKAGKSLGSASFNKFMSRPNITTGYKLSSLPYRDNDDIINMPLYLASKIR